ncbi:MAG: putative monovalent cation/H+ antiporter subunit A [Anaerolineaceae bacterium]|jgi:multicomponent Na+:H+ antiporter subunit A|nr:MAG: putative monovalent cation/H+ antiporter subunit A [Anaerolineaceae bacterium]
MIAILTFSIFAAAMIVPLFFRNGRRPTGWLIALLPLGVTAYLASLFPRAANGAPETFSYNWAEEFGASLSFRADGLSLLFAILITGIGTLVVVYSGDYLKKNKNLGRFYGWLFVFMGAMVGVALSDNLLLLFVFWEFTSLSSFMLIGFEHEKESARAAALQALLVTGGGGLAMLAGIILLGQAGGTLELSALLSNETAVQSHPLYLPALILILLGAFTKSAQFPFHFWLPNAMEAPTPVSAYLHSATMVKAGVYLLARLNPVLGGNDVWMYSVGGVGLLTMLAGSYLALFQSDLKRLLAYSTLSILGTLTMLIGLGTPRALEAVAVLLLAHALYKGALFLVAGALDHETGTRDVTKLGGLFRAMPVTAAAAGIAALSMAGLPPLFGFIAKELVYETGLEFNSWLMAAIIFMGLSNVFVAGVVGVGPFFGRLVKTRKKPHEAPIGMWLGPALLTGLSLLAGLFPGGVSSLMVSTAVSSAAGEAVKVKLALWHGINPAFLLSLGTVLTGIALFAGRNILRNVLRKLEWKWGPAYFYDRTLDGMNVLARIQTRLLQSGYLSLYLIIIILTLSFGAGATLFRIKDISLPLSFSDFRFYEAAIAGLIVGAALAAVVLPSRLGAIAALGVVGYGVALTYLIFGAPDLAMTQFAIESLTVILFVLAFYHLPKFNILSSPRSRRRDIGIALLGGVLMTALVLIAVNVEIAPPISDYFVQNSVEQAHGRNIVNVILVDFRGMDTMGEITVLGIAGIGVYALLKFRRNRGGRQ